MAKKYFISILILLIVTAQSVCAARPRIALVLSGGIASRGLCEIGVIKALEEENIPISYVAGTSMGAVLGSLLAQGYNAAEIERIAKSIDWMSVFVQATDYKNLLFGEKEKYGKYLLGLELAGFKPVIPKSLVNAQKPALLFTSISVRSLDIEDFNKLKIPFRANATDLETGEEVIFKSGYLPKVLQASAAVPMMLPPVEIDDLLLIDGGAVDNLPVDLVKEFSPDVIVAVNLGMELKKKNELNSFFPILSQNLSFTQSETAEHNRRAADVLIEPDISRYSFADFDRMDEIIAIGYRAAKDKIPALRRLLAQKGLSLSKPKAAPLGNKKVRTVSIAGESVYPKWTLYGLVSSAAGSVYDPGKAESDRRAIEDKYIFDGYSLCRVSSEFDADSGGLSFKVSEGKIDLVEFVGRKNISDVFLKDKVRYQPIFNMDRIEENVDRLYAAGFFESVGFNVIPGPRGYTLQYILKEKQRNTLSVGLHYDTYEQLSLLADLMLNYWKSKNFEQTVSLKIGNEYNYQLITEFWPEQFGQNLAGEATLFYSLRNQDLYNGALLNSTYNLISKGGRVAVKANLEPLGQVASGLEVYNVHYEKAFSLFPDENIARLFLRTKLDFLDNPVLPKQGVSARLEYLQGISSLGGNYNFEKIKIDLAGYYPLLEKHSLFADSRIYLGKDNVPFSEYYPLGGESNLLGYGRDQFLGKNVVSARFGYRLPLSLPPSLLLEGVYLSLIQDFGQAAARLSDIKTENAIASYGAELEFNAILGLAGRASLGIGQKAYFFLALGNEF